VLHWAQLFGCVALEVARLEKENGQIIELRDSRLMCYHSHLKAGAGSVPCSATKQTKARNAAGLFRFSAMLECAPSCGRAGIRRPITRTGHTGYPFSFPIRETIMESLHALPLLCATALSLAVGAVQAADENLFLDKVQPPQEQSVGHGRSALWALPDVATQYQPAQPVPAIREALQAQQEGRFLDALIRLEEAARSGQGGEDAQAEIGLLRASFLLQGHQPAQALEILIPLFARSHHAAAAHALAAMAHLQQGAGRQALEAAQQARKAGDGLMPHLALSYVLQGEGHLAEARDTMHGFNDREPQQAVALAREAELALTLDRPAAARELIDRARRLDAAHPYVVAVSGLVHLIDGEAEKARAAFEVALKRDPQDAKALFGLGLAEIKLGHFAEGQKKLQAAHEADPTSALIITYLARAQLQAGQTDDAREHLLDAQEADPRDPVPWLYQAQAELQANQPQQAQQSLREAQARAAHRKVYRGDNLLREDEQQFEANLAEAQRRLGQEKLAFHTLADPVGEKSAATLRNQADLLQGQRFGESARRSLLLQSLFNDRPGNLPAELDIYGDGAGQTGATTPQHGAVSELNAQHVSYGNYDELFGQRTVLAADAISGSRNTSGEQVRFGYGSDTLGVGLALRQFKSDGFAPYQNLDNGIGQAIVQWQPLQSTQVFASYQTFNSKHGEAYQPADPVWQGVYHQYADDSSITRLGLRHSLDENSELRGLLSRQLTRQTDNWQWMSDFVPPALGGTGPPTPGVSFGTNYNHSEAHSIELQYRRNGTGQAWQLGMSAVRSPLFIPSLWGPLPETNIAQKVYVDWQQALGPYWQLQAGLAWGKNDKFYSIPWATVSSDTHLQSWLPRLGLVYSPDDAMHVRLAAWKHLNDASVGDASLAPATVAGVVVQRPGDHYKAVRGLTLGGDKRLGAAWLLEGQAQRRWAGDPVILASLQQRLFEKRIDESRLAMHWQPGLLQVTLAYDDEHLYFDYPNVLPPDSVREQHLRAQQLELQWQASPQWTAKLGWSHNLLAATQASSDIFGNPIRLDVRDSFNTTDASLNWQFRRVGSLDIGVRNAGNRGSRYTEIDPLLPRFSNGRMAYVSAKLAW